MMSDLILLAYAVAFVGGLAFIWRYRRTEWRIHPWGRHVMAMVVVLEGLSALSVSVRFFGRWPGVQIVFLVFSWAYAATMWWRFVLQVRGERQPAPTVRSTDPPGGTL